MKQDAFNNWEIIEGSFINFDMDSRVSYKHGTMFYLLYLFIKVKSDSNCKTYEIIF